MDFFASNRQGGANGYGKAGVRETPAFVVRDMDCAGIGIGGLSAATQQQAAGALDGIKSAVNRVSSQRGYIGAPKNRLGHTFFPCGNR